MLSPIFGKKCGFLPRRMVQIGRKTPFFFSKIGDSRVKRGASFLKNWSKRGYPYFVHFLAVLGISGENGVPDWYRNDQK